MLVFSSSQPAPGSSRLLGARGIQPGAAKLSFHMQRHEQGCQFPAGRLSAASDQLPACSRWVLTGRFTALGATKGLTPHPSHQKLTGLALDWGTELDQVAPGDRASPDPKKKKPLLDLSGSWGSLGNAPSHSWPRGWLHRALSLRVTALYPQLRGCCFIHAASLCVSLESWLLLTAHL